LEAVVERLLGRVRELESIVVQQRRVIAEQEDRIAELQRRLGQDSSTSSRPPSADAPWDMQPAKKRSSRSRSGRKPGKQPGSTSASRSVVDNPDETFEVAPDHCARCEKSLEDAVETARVRRQVADVELPPPPKVTEYQLVSRRCGGCGHVNDPVPTDAPRPVDPGGDLRGPAGTPEQAGTPEPAATEPVSESGPAPAGTTGGTTLHVLTYVDREPYRRGIKRMRNLHEERQGLAKHVFHGRKGELREAYHAGMEDQLGALGLVVNCITLWNTVYLDMILDQLRTSGYPVREEDIARLHPYWYSHINVVGHYSFHPPELSGTGRRPLRDPDLADNDE
jgi:hypothetical protein